MLDWLSGARLSSPKPRYLFIYGYAVSHPLLQAPSPKLRPSNPEPCALSQALLCAIDGLTQQLEGDAELTRLLVPLISTGILEIGTQLAPPVLACGAHLLATVGAAAARANDRYTLDAETCHEALL